MASRRPASERGADDRRAPEPPAELSADLERLLAVRTRRWRPQVEQGVRGLWEDPDAVVEQLLDVVRRGIAARPPALHQRDLERDADPGWLQHESMVGYAAYADRLAGDLSGVGEWIDHLRSLGVTYLHLMPLLEPRPGDSDGGYAVADYRQVDPRLGTMADLRDLAQQLHAHDISLCIDVVANHTAAEHAWARQARAGSEQHLAYYRTYPDRAQPDAWEQTLPEVFPETAPGNFTWDDDLERWVWTTFNPWQWDLDWSNPAVACEMLDIMLFLANQGVDVLRLDAIPFLWKREGTRCQNLPEVHLVLQVLRGLMAIAAPSVALLGEAIVAPDDLVPYQGGAGPRMVGECDLLYHNQLMVQGWSSLAARDGRLATIALDAMMPTPAHSGWVTYVRCHDDIGWAIDDAAAAARGWDGPSHRRFLSSFYAGELDYSYAEGAHFQEDFVSGDRRTSGTAAAMCGITAARAAGDDEALDLAIRRLLLLHALAASYGGIPVLWMGDELALGNDAEGAAHPDNRWMHRPRMDHEALARAVVPGTVEQRVLDGLRALMAARAATPGLRGGATVRPVHHGNPHVLAFRRDHPRTGRFLGLANFDHHAQAVGFAAAGAHELHEPADVLPTEHRLVHGAPLIVAPLSMRWITEAP